MTNWLLGALFLAAMGICMYDAIALIQPLLILPEGMCGVGLGYFLAQAVTQ